MSRSRTMLLLVGAILAAATPVVAQRTAAPTDDLIRIPHEVYTLPNGLTVILAVDHSTPQVAVDVWYHVGSKNEQPGHTGFAHMFEHVMFTGSGHVPYGLHDRYTEGVGGYNNGSTTNDRTNYYEVEPSNYLETALWLESDRMGYLLDKLDEAKFVAQREIVQNERRQSVDNQPYGRADEILTAAIYPDSHPYSWPVVGYMSDLQRATVEDVKAFFRIYYAPTNATLALVGDFDPVQAKAWVKKYFGDLPKGPAIVRPTPREPVLTAEKRYVYEDQVQVPRLYLQWPSVDVKSSDADALSLLGSILTGSRTARLTRALVYQNQSAAGVFAGQSSNEAAGEFSITLTPRPGHTLHELEHSTDSILDILRREGPSQEEMLKAKAGLEFRFVSALQSNMGKAERLLNGLVFHGDAGYFQTQYAAMRAVTAADVQRVANRYLGRGRAVLSVVPLGKTSEASLPESSTKVTVSPDGGHYLMGGH